MRVAVSLDRWLFGPGSSRSVWYLRSGIAALLVARISLWPFAALGDSPAALFEPPWFLSLLDRAPPPGLIIAIQTVGVMGGVAAVAGRRHRRLAFTVAWLAFVTLAGIKTSTGKVLHNDVLLCLVAFPVVFAPDAGRAEVRFGARYGWPLRSALAITSLVYFACAWQKLTHSGLSWVASDNMRWILYAAAAGGRAPTNAVSLFIADRLWLSEAVATGLLALELLFPIVLISRRARPPFAAGVVLLHGGTWLTLGLDYWSWAATAALVLLLSSEWGERRGEVSQPGRLIADAKAA